MDNTTHAPVGRSCHSTAVKKTDAEPGRHQGHLQQSCHHAMCGAADWLGGAVENTTSYTPFNGAYMHYFWAFPDPDTDVLLAKAAELQNMMADHTTYFYPYDNLATDPNPGIHYSGIGDNMLG